MHRPGTAATEHPSLVNLLYQLQSSAMVAVGDKVPAATLKHLGASGIEDISTADLTTGKKVHSFLMALWCPLSVITFVCGKYLVQP